ncbi:MAG: hypothetical protein ACK6BC_01155 [Cyanobacteriota bacterium]
MSQHPGRNQQRIDRFPGEDQTYGILLYSSGSGSEGSLGGLVSLTDRIDRLVADALKRYSRGATCHGCLLLATTSCEQRNQVPNRAVVVTRPEGSKTALFPAQLPGVSPCGPVPVHDGALRPNPRRLTCAPVHPSASAL